MIASFASSREPASIFQQTVIILLTLVLSSVSSHHQRYPRVVHPRIIPHAELSRDRRSAIPRPDDRNLQFVSLNDWVLKTEPNDHLLLSPKFNIQWTNDSTSSISTMPLESCEYREGEIHGHEGSSRVLLTRCSDDFFGLVNLGNRTYLVEPLPSSGSNEHLLYEAEFSRARREASAGASAVYEASRRFYNLSGDTFDAENYEESPELLSERSELGRNNELERPQDIVGAADGEEDVGYFFDRNWQREKLPTRKTVNKFSPPKWLELAIVADHSVIDFHGSRVQQYILALLNIVSAIYKDPSLDSNMQLVVVRMIFYTDKKDGMVHHGNARRSLENVNKWNRKLLSQTNETMYDVAVWLTRLDIGGPSGYAPVSGACDPGRSCALNRDEGLTSAFIIAHEVAHILGLSHDGDKNSGNTCAREAARGSIMAPMVAATFHNFHWSTCSRKEFHRKAKHWSCLLNRPSADDSSIVRASPNEVFSMDEQCRMEFGEGYSRCRNLEASNLCSHLWCGRANGSSQACKTKKGPPLEGTLCAENKASWCINGLCESIDQKRRSDPSPLAVRGATPDNTWGSWSSWSDCSRTCGVAVQHRLRRCNGFCEGDSKEFRLCDLPACSEPVDLRAAQCSSFFQGHGGSSKMSLLDGNSSTWLPYEAFDGSPNCQLVCYRHETGEIFHTGLDVEDGTPCSYETTDICIDGACRPMGCDGVLNSGRSRDACGLCDGRNSTCESVAGKFQRKLRRETTRLAVIPKSSHNIKVVVTVLLMDSVPHEGNMRILVRDGQRKRHEISEFDSDGRAPVMIIESAAFRLERLEEKYVLWSRGPIASEIVVSLIASKNVLASGASISVSWQCALARSELRQARSRYVWILGPCTENCAGREPRRGGGRVRTRELICRDETTRELVSRSKCRLAAKPPVGKEMERCNTVR
ncbi:hypothetical protein TSAR_009108 [Trichomalopsis sarcophagae]|uniref:Peptidase M12B domain-containing protein n=1 Tax=Trichomalopsis sarcophagae TaxID=543379 RepID=A0A232ESI1_9HYME|nr:hypothetical protein TSAR_009108 [Trichomalopsis sarcophagae]